MLTKPKILRRMVIHKNIQPALIEKSLWDLRAKLCEYERKEDTGAIIDEIKKGFSIAKQRHFNKLYFEFAETLYYHFLIKDRNIKKAKVFYNEMRSALVLRDIEEKARIGFAKLSYKLQSTNKINNHLKQEYNMYCYQMEQYIDLKNTSISKFIYPILINNSYFERDYDKTIKYCEDAIELFDSNKTNKSQHIKVALLPLLIIKKRYSDALRLIELTKVQAWGQGFSSSIYAINEIIILIHCKEYQKAYYLICSMARKGKLNDAINEELYILKGYITILANAALINGRKFRLSKILNELPIFTKDKYGNFINIIILKLCIGVQSNQIKLIDQLEGIERAFYRYCEKDSREYLFIKMLLRIPTSGYDTEKITRTNSKDFKLLKSLPLNPENIEIIPLDHLYEIIIKII